MPTDTPTRLATQMREPPPPAERVRQLVRDYLLASGMTLGDLAAEVGYSRAAVAFFMCGLYRKVARRDFYLRSALCGYFDAFPLADDIALPKKLLPTRDTRRILGLAEEARAKARAIIIEGPPGTSKTTALRWYAAERDRLQEHDAFYVRAIRGITGPDLLRRLCALARARRVQGRGYTLDNLVRRLRRRSAVLLVDEAQHLLDRNADAFEQLRDVLDLAGCGCVLAGHFNFVNALSNGHGRQLEQWLSRIDLHDHLRGVRPDELDYIASQWFGEELPADVKRALLAVSLVRDRNAALRTALLPKSSEPLPIRYLSIRRIRKFFERVEGLREIEQNKHKPLAAIARTAIKLLMAPEGRPL